MPADKSKLVTFATLVNYRSEILPPLLTRVAKLSNLQQKIRNELEPPMSEHLFVANFDNKIMTLYTDNPSWAAKLRYNISNILKIVRISCGLSEIQSIRIKVVPPATRLTHIKRKLKLSDQSKRLIVNTAEAVEDPLLQSALLRLSKN